MLTRAGPEAPIAKRAKIATNDVADKVLASLDMVNDGANLSFFRPL
jgi:hypothetical protein